MRRLDGRRLVAERRCYQQFSGTEVPCERCPLRAGETVAACGTRLVVVLRRGRGVAELASLDADPALVQSVCDAWIGRLCRERGVSTKEAGVLQGLMLGRTHVEIGRMLGISSRTVRFHQDNLLRKLDAESRSDLLRVIVGVVGALGTGAPSGVRGRVARR